MTAHKEIQRAIDKQNMDSKDQPIKIERPLKYVIVSIHHINEENYNTKKESERARTASATIQGENDEHNTIDLI